MKGMTTAAILVWVAGFGHAQVARSRVEPDRHAFAGYVVDADGAPVEGACVVVLMHEQDATTTDSDDRPDVILIRD